MNHILDDIALVRWYIGTFLMTLRLGSVYSHIFDLSDPMPYPEWFV